MSLKDIQLRADRMIRADEDNQNMFDEIDKMWHMDWRLPEKLANLDWIYKSVSSDPHDAIRAGTRVLATVLPQLTIMPLVPNIETRELMDRIERGLMWHFENAVRRRNSPLYDIVRYSMMYDKVAAQVVYIPWQEKALGKKSNKKRQRASERYGPYAIIVRDPRSVFAEYSDWMAERVLHRTVMPAHEVVSFWGEKNARKIISEIKKTKDDGANLWYTVFDYQDYDTRRVWAVDQPSSSTYAEPDVANPVILLEMDNELPFLPWVVRQGGSELVPMLYSIYKTGQWDAQNVFETIVSSEVVAYGAAPRGIKTSATPELMRVDYGDPNRDISALPGETYERLRPPELDQNFVLMSDRIKDRIGKSTVPSVIQTGEFPPGTAFATLNLATQSGVKAMNPYKRLAEEAIGDVFAHMLYWIDHTGDTVSSYVTNPNEVTGVSEYIQISPEDFDVNALYIKVELTADVPTDKQQRVNTAALSNQQLFYSNRRALEDIGVKQPGAEIDQWYEEQTRFESWKREQQLLTSQAEQQIQIQGQLQIMQAQAGIAQQQAAQQQGGQPGGGGPPQGPPTERDLLMSPEAQQMFARNRGRGFENARGLGFNPAEGGQPPAETNPYGTRELQRQVNAPSPEQLQELSNA